jgi:hypothetical protein
MGLPAEPTGPGQLHRKARALIGWMTAAEAKLLLAGRRTDRVDQPEFDSTFQRTVQAVQTRPPGIDQTDLITDLPSNLSDHVEQLRKSPPSAAFFEEGWQVKIVDLTRVCALQPCVFTEDADARVSNVDSTDLTAIAAMTLPMPAATPLAAQFDQTKNAWMFSSPNPNLRLIGNARLEMQPGVTVFGFAVGVSPSFLQVAYHKGRHILRDGYHRAYGLLKRGVNPVPAFVREFATFEELRLPPGMLPQDAYLGDRPPLLLDYLDDEVSVDVVAPATQKMIIVQGLELTPIG